jgi:hypothetical protein
MALRPPEDEKVGESLLSRTGRVKPNVKRRRGGQQMTLRWAAGVLEAIKGFGR